MSESPWLCNWSGAYDAIEDTHPVDDVQPMLRSLIDRGAICVVITQGQSRFQRQKITRLSISGLLAGCVLITQDARRVAGYELLDERIDELLGCAEPSDELRHLWVYRCLLDVWGSKSPWFYARCLHAIHSGEGDVEKRLADLATVSRGDWATDAVRFVMIGDRYAKDIRPVIESVGSDCAMTVHLTAGKYNEGFDASELPEAVRPTHSFANMTEVQAFLDRELTVASVAVIGAPPPIAPAEWFDDTLLVSGARCDLQCVQDVARAIIETRR